LKYDKLRGLSQKLVPHNIHIFNLFYILGSLSKLRLSGVARTFQGGEKNYFSRKPFFPEKGSLGMP